MTKSSRCWGSTLRRRGFSSTWRESRFISSCRSHISFEGPDNESSSATKSTSGAGRRTFSQCRHECGTMGIVSETSDWLVDLDPCSGFIGLGLNQEISTDSMLQSKRFWRYSYDMLSGTDVWWAQPYLLMQYVNTSFKEIAQWRSDWQGCEDVAHHGASLNRPALASKQYRWTQD